MAEVVIDWLGGNCPVQAEGTINGQPFYFRARHERWRVEIGDWTYSEPYGTRPYAAGWMEEAEARKFIDLAAEKYSLTKD